MKNNQRIDKTSKDYKLFNEIFNSPELGESHSNKISQHYIRVYSFRYWDSKRGFEYKQNLKELVKKFNSLSEKYTAKISNFIDYETEYDNDRSWPASYFIGFKLK